MKQSVVIVGAGPAGLCLANSLAGTSLEIIVIDKQPYSELSVPSMDGRDIALTHASKRILEDLKVWSRLPSDSISFIREAKVIDGDSSYALHFDSQALASETLGYLVPNHELKKAIYDTVKSHPNITLLDNQSVISVTTTAQTATVTLSSNEKLYATLVVVADGRFSKMRQNAGIKTNTYDFGQTAIVCRMKHEKSHQQTAYECFYYGRTLAILPLSNNHSSIVITASTPKAEEIASMNVQAFNLDIQQQFRNRLGKMELVGDRHRYPLVAVYANQFITDRLALIGDAAVGMHPVTAHGFNLGLKGQYTLSTLIKTAIIKNEDIGSAELLKKYQSAHHRACKPLYLGTNAIVRLFTNDSLVPKILRKIILRVGNCCLPAKKMIMQRLIENGDVQ